jgi:hypothetical protein
MDRFWLTLLLPHWAIAASHWLFFVRKKIKKTSPHDISFASSSRISVRKAVNNYQKSRGEESWESVGYWTILSQWHAIDAESHGSVSMSHDYRTAIAHVRVWGEPIDDDPKNVVSADHGCTAAKQKYRTPSSGRVSPWTYRWPGARRCTSLEHTGRGGPCDFGRFGRQPSARRGMIVGESARHRRAWAGRGKAGAPWPTVTW